MTSVMHLALLSLYVRLLVFEYLAINEIRLAGGEFVRFDNVISDGSVDGATMLSDPARAALYRAAAFVDPNFPAYPVTAVRFRRPTLAGEMRMLIEMQNERVERLFRWPTVMPTSIKRLPHLKYLRQLNTILNLAVSDATERDLENLASLSRLKTLSVVGATDETLLHISKLRQLECLYIIHCPDSCQSLENPVADVACADTHPFAILCETNVTDRGIMHLATLRNIRVLIIEFPGSARISGESISRLSSLPKLQVVRLITFGAPDPSAYDAALELKDRLPYLDVEIRL